MRIVYKIKKSEGKFYAQISMDHAIVHVTQLMESPEQSKKAARIWLRSVHDATARYRRQSYGVL